MKSIISEKEDMLKVLDLWFRDVYPACKASEEEKTVDGDGKETDMSGIDAFEQRLQSLESASERFIKLSGPKNVIHLWCGDP